MGSGDNMTLKDLLTTNADRFRTKIGIADKLSIADMGDLVDSLSCVNLLANTSDKWATGNGNWAKNIPAKVPLKSDQSVTFSCEIKDSNDQNPQVVIIMHDSKGNMLDPWSINADGTRPITTDIGAASGMPRNNIVNGVLSTTFSGECKNLSYIEISIQKGIATTFSYRKPMLTYGNHLIPWTPKYEMGGGN